MIVPHCHCSIIIQFVSTFVSGDPYLMSHDTHHMPNGGILHVANVRTTMSAANNKDINDFMMAVAISTMEKKINVRL